MCAAACSHCSVAVNTTPRAWLHVHTTLQRAWLISCPAKNQALLCEPTAVTPPLTPGVTPIAAPVTPIAAAHPRCPLMTL
jgi:hypothetical protein